MSMSRTQNTVRRIKNDIKSSMGLSAPAASDLPMSVDNSGTIYFILIAQKTLDNASAACFDAYILLS